MLPFLTFWTTVTTCDAGEDVDHVSWRQADRGKVLAHEFVVHEDVHVPPWPPGLLEDSIPDSGEGLIEPGQESGDIARLKDDLILAVRELAEGRRHSHEHA